MYRVTMLSRLELADLREIDDVVRLGHVRSIHRSHLTLENGQLAAERDEVFIDCSARGLAPSPAVPVFDADTIRLQQLRHASPTFNAALIAYLEAHRDDDTARNRLAPPNPYASRPADIIPMLMRTWATAERWRAEPDVKEWTSKSRLNLTRGVGAHMNDPRVRSAVERFAAHVPLAMQNMPTLAATR